MTSKTAKTEKKVVRVTLTKGTASKINKEYAALQKMAVNTLEKAVVIGGHLVQAKAQAMESKLPWQKWVEENLTLSYKQVAKLCNLSSNWDLVERSDAEMPTSINEAATIISAEKAKSGKADARSKVKKTDSAKIADAANRLEEMVSDMSGSLDQYAIIQLNNLFKRVKAVTDAQAKNLKPLKTLPKGKGTPSGKKATPKAA